MDSFQSFNSTTKDTNTDHHPFIAGPRIQRLIASDCRIFHDFCVDVVLNVGNDDTSHVHLTVDTYCITSVYEWLKCR
jgi:hypothetical protein